MEKINHYLTVTAKTVGGLDPLVNDRLTKKWGFQPYGFPYKITEKSGEELICQTMVRYGEPKTEKEMRGEQDN